MNMLCAKRMRDSRIFGDIKEAVFLQLDVVKCYFPQIFLP